MQILIKCLYISMYFKMECGCTLLLFMTMSSQLFLFMQLCTIIDLKLIANIIFLKLIPNTTNSNRNNLLPSTVPSIKVLDEQGKFQPTLHTLKVLLCSLLSKQQLTLDRELQKNTNQCCSSRGCKTARGLKKIPCLDCGAFSYLVYIRYR